MSTSRAVPILRTTDLQIAHGAVERLLRLVVPLAGFRVVAEAQALSLAAAQRMAVVFPEATIGPRDSHRPETNDEIRELIIAGDPRAHAVFPVTLYLENQPVGSIEQAFYSVTGTGTDPASIDWSWFSWPAVPELDLEELAKDAYIQIAVNSRDVLQDIPAADHTLFLHFRGEDTPRAERIARQVGLQVIGPWEDGW